MSPRPDHDRRSLPTPQQSAPIQVTPHVGWNETARAIMFVAPGGKGAVAFPTSALRELGWSGEDAEYRRTLPRFDASPLVRR